MNEVELPAVRLSSNWSYVFVVHWPLDSACAKSIELLLLLPLLTLRFCYFVFRMPTVEAAVGTLKMCQQAQDQLQNAINTVVKAEQQLRENTREVGNVALLHSFVFVEKSFFPQKWEYVYNLQWPKQATEERFLCLEKKIEPIIQSDTVCVCMSDDSHLVYYWIILKLVPHTHYMNVMVLDWLILWSTS